MLNSAPISRRHCDFGKGFYMGTNRTQSLTLICNFPDAKLYSLQIDLSNLKILDMEVGLDWALFVAYNRGKMETIKNSQIYHNRQRHCNRLKRTCQEILAVSDGCGCHHPVATHGRVGNRTD